jgi:ribose transport system substrate-binding protein
VQASGSWRGNASRASRAVTGASVLVAAVLVAAGCGSSSKSSGSGGGTASNGGGSAIVSKCKSMIADNRKELAFQAPGPAIDASKVKGKTVAILSVDQRVPTLAQAATAMQQAAKSAGLKTTLFDAQANPSRMVQGMQQAINQKAGAAILLGIPTKLVPGPIKKLKAASIPMVTVLNNDPVKGTPGQGSPDPNVFATSAPSYSKAGQLEACTAIVATNGKATVAIFSTPDIDPASFVVKGARQILGECSGCKVKTTTQTPLANWSTKLPGLAQSVLRRNPDINYLIATLDQMGLFMATGVRQAASKVPIATFNGTPAVLSLVQKGNVIAADPGEDNVWIGWHTIDQAMRGMLGKPPADPAVPIRYFDKSNLGGMDVNNSAALYGSSYIAGYKKLWGVG